jgi:hypothetical protein
VVRAVWVPIIAILDTASSDVWAIYMAVGGQDRRCTASFVLWVLIDRDESAEREANRCEGLFGTEVMAL